MLVLEQDNIKKRRVDENDIAELDAGDNESSEYEVEVIQDSAVYMKELEDHLSGLSYLVS